MTCIGQKKGVARGRCLFRGSSSQETIAAWPSIDHDALLPAGRQLFRNNPDCRIWPAACGKRGNDAHRLSRKGLCPAQRRGQAEAHACGYKGKCSSFHFSLLNFMVVLLARYPTGLMQTPVNGREILDRQARSPIRFDLI